MDKNEACCANPVPCNNDMVQGNVVKENLTSIITQFCNGAKKLLKFLPPMSNAMEEVREAEEQLKKDLVNIKATSDSKVAFMLTDLQQEFHVFIGVGKDFLESCHSMATFAIHEKQLIEIRQDLKNKMLDKLKLYLDSLSEYLETCEASFKEFKKAHKKMADRVRSAREHFSFQLERAQEDTKDAQKKHEEAVVAKKSSEGVTTACGMLSGGSIAVGAVGAVGIVSPGTAMFQTMFSYFSSFLARSAEGEAILGVMEQQRVREDTARKEKISRDALNCVVELYSSVSTAVSIIGDMKSCTNRASAVIEQKKGLKKYTHSVPKYINFHDLEHKMEMLQEYAREIVNEIGKDGIHPISKNPDELVLNTRLYRETDRRGPRSQNVRKFSDSDEYLDEMKPFPSELDNSSI